ncbi:cellulose binding domain-containing protein [Streptacidiphilus sp. EB103A]|uniref:cellulose binding domain-containing protein n=1 Tax=Streptacidiphilus sp. EB103A TaxID=3156275 RepID=UPI003511F273
MAFDQTACPDTTQLPPPPEKVAANREDSGRAPRRPAITDWKITFGLPAREHVTAGWNVTHSQRGATVTAQPVSYDKTIAAGATLPFGFNASESGTAAQPTWYALNGVRCTGH